MLRLPFGLLATRGLLVWVVFRYCLLFKVVSCCLLLLCLVMVCFVLFWLWCCLCLVFGFVGVPFLCCVYLFVFMMLVDLRGVGLFTCLVCCFLCCGFGFVFSGLLRVFVFGYCLFCVFVCWFGCLNVGFCCLCSFSVVVFVFGLFRRLRALLCLVCVGLLVVVLFLCFRVNGVWDVLDSPCVLVRIWLFGLVAGALVLGDFGNLVLPVCLLFALTCVFVWFACVRLRCCVCGFGCFVGVGVYGLCFLFGGFAGRIVGFDGCVFVVFWCFDCCCVF